MPSLAGDSRETNCDVHELLHVPRPQLNSNMSEAAVEKLPSADPSAASPEGPASANGDVNDSDDDFQYEEVEVTRYMKPRILICSHCSVLGVHTLTWLLHLPVRTMTTSVKTWTPLSAAYKLLPLR